MTLPSDLCVDDFFLLTVIGKGCFGKIFLVKHIKTQKVYAMKVIKKKLIKQQNKINYVFTQRNLLIEFDHPFIINILATFQNEKKIYFVLEYCPGGQLYNLLSIKEKFTEQQAKFYIAQVVLSLEYIHKKEIVYRDLKPQNILIDNQGYIKMTDFGLSKKVKKNQMNNFSLSGMPEYLAPQILNNQDCSKAVDFWCLGSLMYEMMTGFVPFFSQNLNELYESIKFSDFVPDKQANLSDQCVDLLKKLFIKNPKLRFGMKDIRQIQQHPWFTGINWQAVINKKYRAPFVPILQSQSDTSYFCPQVTEEMVNSVSSYDQSHADDQFNDDSKFEGFDFGGDEDEEQDNDFKFENRAVEQKQVKQTIQKKDYKQCQQQSQKTSIKQNE